MGGNLPVPPTVQKSIDSSPLTAIPYLQLGPMSGSHLNVYLEEG